MPSFEIWRGLTETEKASLKGYFEQHNLHSVDPNWINIQEQGDFTVLCLNLAGGLHIGVSKRSGNDRPRRSKGVVEAFKRAWESPPVRA